MRINIFLLAILMLSSPVHAELATASNTKAPKPTTIKGKVEYGCGGTTGTMCYLVTAGDSSYVISMGRDTTDSATQRLNQAIESNQCIAVTGKIKPKKMGVFKVFDAHYAIEIGSCTKVKKPVQGSSTADWIEIGKTDNGTINLKISSFQRKLLGTNDAAACVIGQTAIGTRTKLNQYCVFEKDCSIGYGKFYILEVDFMPSVESNFALGSRSVGSDIAGFLCAATKGTNKYY